jgi:hypothetical protein
MKKFVLIIAAIAICTLSVNAQNMFEKGTQLFKFGVGVNDVGVPIEVTYEKGIIEDFLTEGLVLGIGANVGYYGYKQEFASMAGPYSWKYTNMIIAGRALGHYSLIDKLDTYAGLVLGYNVASVKYSGANEDLINSPTVGGLVFGGLVGARYEFNPNLGIYAEAGYSISYLNVGLAYKF